MATPPLTLDVVPRTCHYSNLRTELPRATWDVLRRAAYAKTNRRCAICGGRGRAGQNVVEAHERWDYVPNGPEGPVQRLVEIQALCPDCHEVKHFGLAQVRGREEQALAHLMEVNGWSRREATDHVREEASEYEARSMLLWDLDVSVIDDDESTLTCFSRRREKNKALRNEGHDRLAEFVAKVLGEGHGEVSFEARMSCPRCGSHDVFAVGAGPHGAKVECRSCWAVTYATVQEDSEHFKECPEEDEEDELAVPQADHDALAGFKWVK